MALKLIPNQREIQKLSPKDKAYWRGYFDGFRDSAVRSERPPAPALPPPYGESVTVQRNGRSVTIYDHPESSAMFTRFKAEAEADHVA